MTQGPGQPHTPRGWYIEPHTGRERLWDGRAWGPYRPPRTAMSVFAHLGALVAPVAVSLVLRLTARPDDRFTRHHATEALNKDIWLAVLGLPAYLAYAVLTILGSVAQARPDLEATTNGEPGASAARIVLPGETVWAMIALAVFALGNLLGLVLSAVAAMKTGRREYYRYPLPFRFVPGSLKGAERDRAQEEIDQATSAAARVGLAP